MKKNKGFTLVELLAVIVLLAILIAIAVPNALNMSNKVKQKTYSTKIDLIEQAGISYGQENLNTVKKGISLRDQSEWHYCNFTYNGDEISGVSYNQGTADNLPAASEGTQNYWCVQVPIKTLVGTNNLEWDEKNACPDCQGEEKEAYNDIVTNSVTGYIINECNVYVYYKYTRIYAYFDRNTCDKQVETYAEAKDWQGKEYRPK